MSQWTHVAGIIRIDSMIEMLGSPDTTERILRDRLGYTWGFGGFGNELVDDAIDDSPVPFGSEGSIQYDIVKTRPEEGMGKHSLSWGHIAIHGDLRDFDNPQEIYDWLVNSLATINDDGIGFREVVVIINVEFQERWLVILNNEMEKMVIFKNGGANFNV